MESAGNKIKAIRESRNISIDDMAQRTQLSKAQIVSIENGETLPSLAPLLKISRVLGVRLGTFLDDSENRGAVVKRAGDHSVGVSFSNDSASSKENMQYFSLSGSKDDRHIESYIINILPTDKEDFTSSTHEGEEFIYVLEGKVEIVYGKNIYVLNVGDSIHYDSIINHHVHGYEGQSAKILAVLYAPIN